MQKEIKRYAKNLVNAEKIATKKGLTLGVFSGLTFMLFNFVFAIGIYYATYLTRTDCENYTPGGVMKSLMLMITATFALGQAMPYLKDLAEARGAAKSIFSIIEKKSEINTLEKKDKKVVDKFVGEIKLENVFFNYPQRPDAKILTGLSLNIPSGKTIALCGSSGCGKSTVIQLLQRFYEPLSGSIEYDGVNIKDLDLEWLRSNISLVSQEPILFSTSIRENIRLGRLDATDAEIEEAARAANAHDFIQQCPDKYSTQVGERGSQLSGGQKQRIAIARAILKKPRILLLDEATSALDNESEKIVQEALDRVKHGRTTIVVAHRLSTIRNADLIVGLEGGQVKEMGAHEELMKLKGVYYELVMLQTKQEQEERGEQVGEEKTMGKKLKQANEKKEIKLKEMRNEEEDEASSDEQNEEETSNFSYLY
jgi:ABC-type multidrug transport system fused ATPase/permease subunit